MPRLLAAAAATPVAVAVAERPLDLVHLARQTLGDASLEREVLDLFVRQSVLLLRRLETGEARVAREAVHTLKGSAQGIGAWQVVRAAEAVEAGAEAGLAGERRAALARLEAAVAATNAMIHDLAGR